MIVSLPSASLNDDSSKRSSSSGDKSASSTSTSRIFSMTPSIKQLFETVKLHHQPSRSRPTTLQKRSNKDSSLVKPEDEISIIASVEQASPTLDQKQVVKSIAGHLISILDDGVSTPDFEGKQTPTISIHDYVDRLIRYVDAWAGERPSIASTGVSAALLGIEYLDRLHMGVSPKSVHRLYMCAVLVAVKFTEDFSISNRFWAKVAGIDLQDMNRMELVFCGMLNWKLKISREEFESQQVRFAEPVF